MPGFTHQSSITSAFRVSKTSQCGSSSKPIVLTDDTNNGDSSSETDVVVAPAVPPTTPPKRKRDDSHEAVEEIQRPPKPSPLIAAYRSEKRPLPLRNRPLETFQRKIQEAVRFR
ncbi:hypothetical protein AAP_05723 [Ascosphaera apis ARSEF 7405]|uniref:Uncharacterized protein n=1 Tax=Ascosphaera apis ARSEF 7405 TaxID=392613 RepID=A0A162ID70_9EURO|nr:hypothetical protein AAP_05723 [Ascosphaera apis ARSEF 7405]